LFHLKLLELEAELIAREETARGVSALTPECIFLMQSIESEIGVTLAAKVPQNWRGWLYYKRKNDVLIICRGRAFPSGMFGKCKAGFDVSGGADAISDYERHFDVTPSQDIDHLMINFGCGEKTRIFIWYGEGIAAYKLIYEAAVEPTPEAELHAAVVEACKWILKRPKQTTLLDYLKQHEAP
jgi:hypothetical protein